MDAKELIKVCLGIVGTVSVGNVLSQAVKTITPVGASKWQLVVLGTGAYIIGAGLTSMGVNAIMEDINPLVDLFSDLSKGVVVEVKPEGVEIT